MAVRIRSTYCTCGLRVHANSVRQRVFQCKPCHRRTYMETRLGNLIGEIAARVINDRQVHRD